MAGELVVGEINGIDVSAIQDQVATAWVTFNGIGTVAIRDSYNVSSITDNGTGDHTVNFATAMSNVNYSVQSVCIDGGINTTMTTCMPVSTPTASSVRIGTASSNSGALDSEVIFIAIHGGK